MRVLFLTHRLPYAPNRGDRVRAYHLVRTLALQTSLEVVSLAHDEREAAETGAIEALGASVTAVRTSPFVGYLKGAALLTTQRPLTHSLLDAPRLRAVLAEISRTRPPDVVLAYCSGMARFALEPPLAHIPSVIDFVDIDSEKWNAMAGTSSWPRRWVYAREALTLGRFESQAAERAVHSLVVTDRERRALERIAPRANIHVVFNGVSSEHLRPHNAPTQHPVVVFCGVMNYGPNVDGVLWFASDVWPLVRARVPHAKFVIVGANPTDAIRRLQQTGPGITVTGTVTDVREYLWNAAVSVAPLLTARGLQNKVLEALAAGLPAVVTPQVMEGLPASVHAGCSSAATADEFATATATLLESSPVDRRARAARAALESLSWDQQLAPVYPLLRDAITRGTAASERGKRSA